MTTAEVLLASAGVAAVLASAFDRPLVARGGAVLAGILALAAAVAARAGAVLTGVAAAIALVNLARIGLAALAGRRSRFSEEEERMVAAGLTSLTRAQARHLLDQGIWIDGKAGEVLTREAEPVSHLFYLAQGTARVTSRGRWVATSRAPTFVGEITVLGEAGATATVTLDAPSRFWCVPAPELRLFLRENPALRGALENSFVGTLAEKLRVANRVIAAGGQEAAAS